MEKEVYYLVDGAIIFTFIHLVGFIDKIETLISAP